MKHRRQSGNSVWIASLLALLLAGTAACGNVDDSTPQPTDESASPINGSCTTIDHTVTIDDQQDLDAFAGLGCFTIEGHLFIQETTDIQDLDELSGLRSVSGYIGIADNTALVTVNLPNLESTGEGLVLEGNHQLISASFPSLEEVGGYLHVFNNQRLRSASFRCLEEVGGDVIFAGVNKLTKLKLPCLKKIGGTFIFEHSDKLEYLCLPQLRYVGDQFLVHFNPSLKAILAPNLKYVGGLFEIQRNAELVKVKMGDLEKVKGDVKIVYNHEWSKCKVYDLVHAIDYIAGTKIIHSNYEKCRSVKIYPPKWCSTDACKKCKCKDDVYCEEPGDDDDDDDDDHGDDDDDDDDHGDDDDDDDDHDKTCEDRCMKKAQKLCKPLKGHQYKYNKCVQWKYKLCVDAFCQAPGDDDDDDDDDDGDDGDEACTPGYWKNHPGSWCASYDDDPSLNSVFSDPSFVVGSDSFSDALNYGGGSGQAGAARILLRHAVASLLNACTIDYPLTETQVKVMVNDAIGTGSRMEMLSVASYLDGINNDNMCPLNGGPVVR